MQRRHCGWWDQPPLIAALRLRHQASHNDGRLAGRRLSGIHELLEQLHGEEGGFSSSSITLASVGGIVVTLPATTTRATHVNVYLSRTRRRSYLLASVAVGTP